MKRAILRIPEDVEKEIGSLSDGKTHTVSTQLARVLLMALGEPVEILGDDFDMDNPAPRRLRIWNSTFVEERYEQ